MRRSHLTAPSAASTSRTWSSTVTILPGRDAERQQVDEVGPDRVPGGALDLAGPRRNGVDAVPEEHLAAVDVADAGEHRLVHEQLGDRSCRCADPRARRRPGRVRAAAGPGRGARVTASTCSGVMTAHRIGPRRSATWSSVASRSRTCPDDRDLGGIPVARRRVKDADEAEVHVQPRVAVELGEEVLAPRGGVQQLAAGERGRAGGEPALRAAHLGARCRRRPRRGRGRARTACDLRAWRQHRPRR